VNCCATPRSHLRHLLEAALFQSLPKGRDHIGEDWNKTDLKTVSFAMFESSRFKAL